MGSPLDYISSEKFRKDLMKLNLTPYPKSPYKQTPPVTYEVIQSNLSVKDSPDALIDEPSFANELYPLNQYGAEGGYKQVPDPGALQNRKSNEGEYGFQDANIIDEGYANTKQWQKINPYADPQNIIDSAEAFSTLDPLILNNGRGTNAQPYPTTFVSSFYSPVSILLSRDPRGSDGLLSQDSYIAKLGAQLLRKGFEDRIGREIIQRTVARANIFTSDSGTDVLSMLTGRIPLIEPNYSITVPSGALIAATDFALKLAGSTIPVSPIPGSYFDPSINPARSTTLQQINLAFKNTQVGKFFNRLLGASQTGSQLFLNNTGGGQKSRLFDNLNYNKFKPGYSRNVFDRLLGSIVGTRENSSNFYVGSITSDPSRIFSPSGELPVSSTGIEQQAPVIGPSALAQAYEGEAFSKEVKFGANGVSYINGGGIEGGMTWVSPGTESNAGKKAGIGGDTSSTESIQVLPSFGSTISTDKEFKDGSILDDTQRLIDSAPKTGGRRLQHVGNAIDQISKVFNDGYKEMTKGSKVVRYAINNQTKLVEGGIEYCRVFSKDLPYLQYNDLQKVDGMVSEGRKYSWSVLNNTYNLNMYPVKTNGGQDSTNLIGVGGAQNSGYAKKYMFSLENLSWRTSSKPEYTISDLPVCERGPNGGRVMWFPPYDLKFGETVGATWKGTDFLGRPEPIYTYVNTNRSGTLSWKIVVDHPSVLNVIVNKVLSNDNNRERVNSIIESFFAGCMKYDLYELAKAYPTISPNDLYFINQQIDGKKITPEEVKQVMQTITTGVDGNKDTTPVSPQTTKSPDYDFKKFTNLSFYFDNKIPQTTGQDFQILYANYISPGNQVLYQKQSSDDEVQISNYFSATIKKNFEVINSELIDKIDTLLKNNEGTITINLEASASAADNTTNNQELSQRRLDCIIDYFKKTKLNNYISNSPQRLIIRGSALGETAKNVQNKFWDGSDFKFGDTYNCSDEFKDSSKPGDKNVFTIPAMSCRRVFIKSIEPQLTPPKAPKNDNGVVVGNQPQRGSIRAAETNVAPETTDPLTNRPSLSKKILRLLLSECDYFDAIKEDTPMVYDNLKEKLKFFDPAFHSTTPEGLNSRLTFLQQCFRPGDTIPVSKNERTQSVQYTNAINTAFGAPPVLILRIGDFYNTKIIPESLNIQFEGLDINPEGIGVQPMIANVSLGFKFVGGSGLKTAVDRLQNSLTFNYYANTEMYDDRAYPTDDSYIELDKQFQPPPTENQVQDQPQKTNGQTIGDILDSKVEDGVEMGTMSYSKFMDGMRKESEEYFKTIVNKNREILKQYNNSIRQLATIDRNYVKGDFSQTNTNLYGKPYLMETKINKIFEKLIAEVSDGTEGYISYISEINKDFSEKLLRTVKYNYINILREKQNTFQSALTTIIQDLSILQQNYIKTLTKGNIVAFTGTTAMGTDGLQDTKGDVKIYYLDYDKDDTSKSVYNGIIDDMFKIQNDINLFLSACTAEKKFEKDSKGYSSALIVGYPANGTEVTIEPTQVFKPISKIEELNSDVILQRVYTILNKDIIDDVNYLKFKEFLIGNIKNNEGVIGKGSDYEKLEKETDAYWIKKTKPIFQDENNLTDTFFNELEKTDLKNFIIYTPYSDKTRELSYVDKIDLEPTPDEDRVNYIKYLGLTKNDPKCPMSNWNDEEGGIYKPKAKLN